MNPLRWSELWAVVAAVALGVSIQQGAIDASNQSLVQQLLVYAGLRITSKLAKAVTVVKK